MPPAIGSSFRGWGPKLVCSLGRLFSVPEGLPSSFRTGDKLSISEQTLYNPCVLCQAGRMCVVDTVVGRTLLLSTGTLWEARRGGGVLTP